MSRPWLRLIPIVAIIAVVAILWRGLYLNPKEIPSPLINKPAPSFQLPDLLAPEKIIDNQLLKNKVTIVNVWASWCDACVAENQLIEHVANDQTIQWLGFDYKDNSRDAKAWLQQHGNPYRFIAADQEGQVALDWGIYGTPETFVIDKKGLIRYKHMGPISWQDWQQQFLPLLAQLKQEPI